MTERRIPAGLILSISHIKNVRLLINRLAKQPEFKDSKQAIFDIDFLQVTLGICEKRLNRLYQQAAAYTLKKE